MMNHFDEAIQVNLCNNLKHPESFELTYNKFVEEVNKMEEKYHIDDISKYFEIESQGKGVVFKFTDEFRKANAEIQVSVMALMTECGLTPSSFIFGEV